MNLLRLLSAGRSLVGLKDSTARYRMSDPKAMPKFGSGNNPFWAKRELQCKAEPRAPLPSAAPACRSERETESAAKGRVLRYRSSVVAGVARWRANLSDLRGGLIERARSLLPRPRLKQQKPAIPQFPRAALQGELSLDSIRVVRNDLRDADLELVPAKASAAAPAAPGQMTDHAAQSSRAVSNSREKTPASGETAWRRTVERLVGVAKS